MPEGPEIHRAADRVRKAILDQPAVEVFFGLPQLAALAEGLTGQRVVSVTAHGKAMLTGFEDGRAVFTHNQLYGRWYVAKAGTRPHTRRSLRFMVETTDKAALLYSASTIEVLSEDDLPHHPFLSKLGPDPLHREVTARRIARQLEDRAFRGRSLGALLLDQSFVAGLGNYLRSEILHAAGLLPDQRPRDLAPPAMLRLAKAILSVTRRSYRTGGITNEPATVTRLKAAGWPRRAYRHWVFGRGGRPCHRCGSTVQQQTVAGRRLYLCAGCQGVDGPSDPRTV